MSTLSTSRRLLTLLLAVALLAAGLVGSADAGVRSYVVDAEALVVDLVNEARAAEGHPDVAPVAVQPDLVVAARDWSTRMADTVVGHDPDLGAAVCCWTSVADLVGGASAPADRTEYEAAVRVTFETWMAGAGNRANVVREHVDHVGVGVLHDTSGQLWLTVILREWDGSDTTADHVAPVVDVTTPFSGAAVTGQVTVEGTASDDVQLDQVTVQLGDATPVPAALEPDGSWRVQLSTEGTGNGTQPLLATAFDTSGNSGSDQIVVEVDNPTNDVDGPTLTLARPVEGQAVAGPFDVRGAVSDPSGIDAVTVVLADGPTTSVDVADDGTFELTVDPLEMAGELVLEVTAVDARGNRTVEQRTVRASSSGLVRLAGPTRHDTAAVVSRAVREQADTVVVAWSGNFADALAGGPLAADGEAPLLLNPTDVGTAGDGQGLDAAVVGELLRLRPETVVLLGGTSVLSEDVAIHVRSLVGADVVRMSGGDRYATAAAISGGLPAFDHAYLVEGTSAWPDAVSVGAVAAATGSPILLSGRESVPAATLEVLAGLDVRRVTLVGGTGVLAPSVADQLGDAGMAVARLGGADRYATSAAVAEHAVGRGLSDGAVWVATGRNYPDALAAGPAAAAVGATVLLVDGLDGGTDDALWRWLAAREWRSVVIVGGTSVVTPPVADRLGGLIRG